MDVYVYSDESGVFDNKHYKIFVYAGLIFTDVQQMELINRKYVSAERQKRKKKIYSGLSELKAFYLKNDDRNDLYKLVRDVPKFAVVINQNKVDSKRVFANAKTKQHYLDFAYVSGVKKAFEVLVAKGTLLRSDEVKFHFLVDEHSTSNDGNYDLRDVLLKELKESVSMYSVPLFPKAESLCLHFCKSDQKPLVRAADIVANKVYSVYREDSSYGYDLKADFISIVHLP